MVKKKLPIEYNPNIPIGVISDDPLTFLQLDRLFDDFLVGTDDKQQWLDDLGFSNVHLNVGIKNSQSIRRMLHSKKFVAMVNDNPKRKFVLYSPLDPPYKVNPLTYLMNSPTIAHAYENKRYFRDEFADLIRMPEYETRYIDQLDKAAAYKDLRTSYGDFVLQDEESSGSKGTYIIKDHDSYVDAINSLKKFSHGRSVVISKYYEGTIASIQVCITKYGIFSGGVQRQLVNSKYLCNPGLDGVTKWCGGEVGDNFPDIVQHQAQEMATIVGSELASHGYKGIFGIDLIISPSNEVYAIEINARLTGYSHLISDMQLKQGKIPFILLHVLELGNFNYEVTDLDALPSISRYNRPVSFMIVNNSLGSDFVLKHYVRPGIYRIKDDKLVFEKEAYSIDQLKGEDSLLILCRHNEGATIESGKRILKITKMGKTIAKNDLGFKAQKVVEIVKKHFELPE